MHNPDMLLLLYFAKKGGGSDFGLQLSWEKAALKTVEEQKLHSKQSFKLLAAVVARTYMTGNLKYP